VSAALLWAYSAHLKRRPFVGNLAVALILGLALLYGGLAVGGAAGAAVGAAFAFLTTLAREIVKDVEDLDGDRLGGARTLATTLGPRPTAWIALVPIALAVAGLAVPVYLPTLGPSFLLWSLPAALALLLAASALIGPTPDAWPRAAGRSSAWLKASMAAGIVALAAVRLGA
jgi:geranylgeranylglycerol-phosphate geranylgeranyltransferase